MKMSSLSLKWSVGERVSGLRDPPCRAQQRPSRVLTLTEASGRGSSRRGCRGGTHLSFPTHRKLVHFRVYHHHSFRSDQSHILFSLFFFHTTAITFFFLQLRLCEPVFGALHHRITPPLPPRQHTPTSVHPGKPNH